jgi:4-amino-4-deoxy-L-arabinose transferase-like glycosyltransferase
MATRAGDRTDLRSDVAPAAPAVRPVLRDVVRTQVAVLLGAVGVLALAVFLHVYRLSATPGWDPQEGYNLDIAWNLLHGRLRLFGLTSAFAQHPPLFYLQLALVIRVFGYSIGALRGLVAFYSVLTCAAMMLFSKRLLGTGPALWAGLVFTGAPLFLANTRWGYTYAQLMFVAVLCAWALWRYSETRSRRALLVAASLAGLAVLSDYEGIAMVVVTVLIAWRVRPRDALSAAGIALGIPATGMLACFAVAPAVFGPDLLDTFARASGTSLALSAINLLVNYFRLVTLDVWVLLGIVGLFLVGSRRARVLLLATTSMLALVVLKVRDVGPSFHTAVPLLPFLALGTGVALDAAIRHLYAWILSLMPHAAPPDADAYTGPSQPAFPSRSSSTLTPDLFRLPDVWHALDRRAVLQRGRNALAALAVFVVVVSPLAIALAGDVAGLASTLPTRQDAILASPADAQAVAEYVLAHAAPGDLTLGSPQVVWMLDQPDDASGHPRSIYAADMLQALAYQGQAAAFYPAGLPAYRWAFPVSLAHARFVILDTMLVRLSAPNEVPGLAAMLATVRAWPVVYRRGDFTVYANPSA